jgi:hypothetical protein
MNADLTILQKVERCDFPYDVSQLNHQPKATD